MRLRVDFAAQDLFCTGHGQRGHLLTQAFACAVGFLGDVGLGRGKHELELAAKKAGDNMRDAKAQAAEVIAQAEKRAAQIVEEAKAAAKEEGDRQLAAAQANIAQETNRARESLREQVAGLAVAGAEKILRREVNVQTHADLLGQLKAEL